MTHVPAMTLNNGVQIPQLGFGVWQVPNDQVATAVQHALENGYRHIDTAAAYGNEEGVGAALAETDIPRDQIFVTTKVWNNAHGYDEALKSIEDSLGRLRLDYVDLVLIHWPVPSQDKYVETWKGFEQAYRDGHARAIGVSNFHRPHLQRLFDETEIVPVLDQIELHPYLQQAELREFLREHEIGVEDWSPLAYEAGLLEDPLILDLARKYGKSPAQFVLRWHIQLGHVVLSKSVTPSRIAENIDLFDIEIAPEDMAAISALDRGQRTGPDPDTFG